jgi:hypothetical protein
MMLLPIPLTLSTDSAKLRPSIPANFVHSTIRPRSPLGDDLNHPLKEQLILIY